MEPVEMNGPSTGASGGLAYGMGTPQPFDFTLTSISFVVHDLESTISSYARLFGWGPFQIFDSWFEGPGNSLRGEEVRYHLRWSECVVSPGINIEFIQPLEGPGVWQEWLRMKGEGVYCLGTMMRTNKEAEFVRQWFEGRGIDAVMEGSLGEGVAWYLLDTVPMLKAMLITGGGHSIDWDAGGASRTRNVSGGRGDPPLRWRGTGPVGRVPARVRVARTRQ